MLCAVPHDHIPHTTCHMPHATHVVYSENKEYFFDGILPYILGNKQTFFEMFGFGYIVYEVRASCHKLLYKINNKYYNIARDERPPLCVHCVYILVHCAHRKYSSKFQTIITSFIY